MPGMRWHRERGRERQRRDYLLRGLRRIRLLMARFKVSPFKHHLSRWPIVMPLYDGRQCPACSAVVLGWQAQQVHETHHREQDEFNAHLLTAAKQLAEKLGATIKPPPEDDEEDEDLDERLSAKARKVHGFVIGSGELPPETRGGED